MELLKGLKSEYGGINQAQAEKLLITVQELVEDLSDEVMEALAMGESEEEMGPMFGANIKFTPPTTDPYDALDLSYLSNVVEDGAFNLGSSLSFKLDSLPIASSDGNITINMIDTTWLEETLREAYPDQQVSGVIAFKCCSDLFFAIALGSLRARVCDNDPGHAEHQAEFRGTSDRIV